MHSDRKRRVRRWATPIAIAASLALIVPATAATTRAFYLNTGDSAFVFGGESRCDVVRLRGGKGFRCYVGGDYRARYGVSINSRDATITRYTGFNRYRVVVRKRQSPIGAS